MSHYLMQRLVIAVFVLFGVSVIVFFVVRLIPGDPALVMAGPMADPAHVERIRVELGLRDAIPVQYLKWIGRAVLGDLGRSISLRRSVLDEVDDRFRATAILAGAAILLSFPLGILIGIVSAVKQYSFLDRIFMLFALLGISAPVFWTGLVLMVVFSVWLRILPGTGMHTAGGGDFFDMLRHLVLPAFTLSLPPLAVIARMTRSNMLEVIRQDYIRTARSKGLAETAVIMRHALRNALVGIVTILGMQSGFLLGGAVYVETVFAWPGVGYMLVNAILKRDYPLIQGGVLLVATSYVVINLVTDLLYAYLDPRIRYD
jgi:peptide/nickel transport system permease protein